MILDKVSYPKDLKNLSNEELTQLASEIRQVLITKLTKTGGHLAPNLGMVEATIALHYVFDCPKDKVVFDISHQSYVHKILTGRKDGFTEEKNYKKYTTFTDPTESEYDLIKTGHSSISISFATGLAKARDINKEKYNIITIIGDGAMTGGQAYEGLNNAGTFKSNFIVLLNDNEWSIAENNGSLVKHLADLRNSGGKCQNNLFKALGFDYYYVENGHSIPDLIEAFKKVKDIDHPVLVHFHTIKGKGYEKAEKDPEHYHGILPGDKPRIIPGQENYLTITREYLLKEIKKGNNIVVVSAATPLYSGLEPNIRKELGEHYHDVAIAEQDAMSFISGIAKNKAKPVLYVASTFMQRTYDQLLQDLALNKNPATILVTGGGISSASDTHLGLFDIPLITSIPDFTYLNPTCKEEYLKMLDFCVNVNKEGPIAIRIPSKGLISTGIEDNTDYSIKNKFKIIKKGNKVAFIGLGSMFKLASETYEELKKDKKIEGTLINPIFASGLDKELLEELKKEHDIVVCMEDGLLEGGFGHRIAAFYADSKIKVLLYGTLKEFINCVPMEELNNRYRLKKELIIEDIMKHI
ncbi:MAG: 1-deoxy-D-xylulose-5-phosphate synthase [Clostridia bacterium]|nr:1-deoxy-D-xylulose-5-phosphate synthase [Clostridia bacterium]